MTEIIGTLGALASVIGAFFAWRYATNAERFAERAEKQVAKGRRISDLATLETLWSDTYTLLAPFGPSASASELRGVSPSKSARKVQDYLETVGRYSASLQRITSLDSRIDKLNRRLKKFADARSSADLKETGSRLLSGLNDLNASIHSSLVRDHEKVDFG